MPPKREPPAPTLRFSAELTRYDSSAGSWTMLPVPERVTEALRPWALAGRVPVLLKVKGAQTQTSLFPAGKGRQVAMLSAALRREADLTAGDTVTVTVSPLAADVVLVPADLAEALDAEEGARAGFDALDVPHRRSLVRFVEGARTETARARAVAKAVDAALGRESEEPRRKGKAGWHCPDCGRFFPKANAAHRCETLSVEVPFARKDPSVRALFETVRAAVEALGPSVQRVTPEGVGFIGRRKFLSAVPRAKWLELRIQLPRRVEDPVVRQVFTAGPSVHIHIVRLAAAKDWGERVRELVRDAYADARPDEPLRTAGAADQETPEGPRARGPSGAWERAVDDDFFAGLNDE